jgi:hypothetical protein
MEFVQHMVFCNLFNALCHTEQLRALVFKCLFDEQFEVRSVASVTLSGFYQCGYIQVNNEDFVNIFLFVYIIRIIFLIEIFSYDE